MIIGLLFQDIAICDVKGRDCIEKSSSKTFECNTTCTGIYADVEWVGKSIEEEFKDDDIHTNFEGKIDDELLKVLIHFKTDMMRHMKNDVQDVMKIATGQRGKELDREKYNMLVAEYRNFKTKNVKHFKFNSAANLSMFGKDVRSMI